MTDRKSVFDKYFVWEQLIDKDDKYYQQFKLRLERTDIKQYIDRIRKDRRLNPNIVNRRIKLFLGMIKKNDKVLLKAKKVLNDRGIKYIKSAPECRKILDFVGYTRKNTSANEYLEKLQRYTDSKIALEDIKLIIKTFKLPYSWEYPLRYYVLTKKILNPLIRCRVFSDDEKVIIEVSPEATKTDLNRIFKRVCASQAHLPGFEIKKDVRKRKDFDTKLRIKNDGEKYRKLKKPNKWEYDDTAKKKEPVNPKRDALVYKYNPKINYEKDYKKEWAKQRQIYHRYK